MSEERVAVFIDGSNLFFALRDEFHNLNLDFESLVNKLVGDRKLVRTYYYTALPNQKIHPDRYVKQQSFLDALREKPYFRVVLGRLERRRNTYVEKGVDIAMAVDILTLSYNDAYDTAILISGDGDLARPVEIVQRMGKHVENVASPSILSKNLRQTCDAAIVLDSNYLADCWRE